MSEAEKPPASRPTATVVGARPRRRANGATASGRTPTEAPPLDSTPCQTGDDSREEPRPPRDGNAVQEPAPYQRALYAELEECARDLLDFDWSNLAIRARHNHLLAGSTGTGKTFIIEYLARRMGLGYLRVSAANWVLVGATARGAECTLAMVYRFLAQHPRSLVHVDEVDKLSGKSDWTRYVMLELFSVLDRQVQHGIVDKEFERSPSGEQDDGPAKAGTSPAFPAPSEAAIEFERAARERRFGDSCLIIGSGAWQSLWDTAPARGAGLGARGGWEHVIREFPPAAQCRSRTGAATASRPREELAYARLLADLPQELINRFRGDVLFLPPLAAGDYRDLLDDALARLPGALREPAREIGLATLNRALQRHEGYRWLEAVVAGAVRHHRRELQTVASLPRPPEPRTPPGPYPVCSNPFGWLAGDPRTAPTKSDRP